MLFPISQVSIPPLLLVGVGLLVGAFGGLFGVGGSFIAGPSLFALGLPMHYVVGTDLATILGTAAVGARRHRSLGNVDFKLALLLTGGTIAGVELGARLVARLTRRDEADAAIGLVAVAVFFAVSAAVGAESFRALRRARRQQAGAEPVPPARARWWQRLPPCVSLPDSGIERLSIWAILAGGFATGLFSGFLGGGGGYLRMPMLVYLLGVPTHVAVGTDLAEVVLSAGFGTVSHALKGNVDILIALAVNAGAVLGARAGATLVSVIRGPRLRLAFSPLPAIGAIVLLATLIHRGFH